MQQSDSPYNLLYTDQSDYIVFNKRSGFRTHKVNENQLGLVEVLSSKLNQELYVVHRLDKETSGLILFAKNKTSAANLSLLFENREVKKTYYFLTDQSKLFEEKTLLVKTHIEKIDKKFVNNLDKEVNSETKFTFIKKNSDSCFLWKAEPLTGKPHQIRLHAEKIGIPILGDAEHGGSSWFRLALHAAEISFIYNGKNQHYSSPLPYCFENSMNSLGDFITNEYIELKTFMHVDTDQTYRLYHRTNQDVELRADLFGSILWIYWYKAEPPTSYDLSSLETFCNVNNLNFVIRHMTNRGQGVGGKEHRDIYYTKAPNKWIAKENMLLCELRRDQGFSPGLFLDQRSNREFVKKNSQNKTVLNLFSYTSVFSVAAAFGNAKKVTSVDASRTFLEWSKDNFKLNNLDINTHEFFAQDTILFLEGSVKRKRKWDVIICDPPSFGRTKATTWKLEKDFPLLANLLWSCLNEHGLILFTCNYEKWSLNHIYKEFEKALPKGKFSFQDLPIPDLDFEFPDAFDNLLKGVIIRKNN